MTKTDLKNAIREILTSQPSDGEVLRAHKAVDYMFSDVGLPVVCNMAGQHAFLREMTGPAVDTIREALKSLESPGWFEFDGEDDD